MKRVQNTHMQPNQGISLLLLVIIVIIMLVLASAVIFNSQKNSPVDHAKQAAFQNVIDTIRDKYHMEYAMLLVETMDRSSIKDSDLAQVIPEKYSDVFVATTEGISYIGTDEKEKQIASEMGIDVGDRPDIPTIQDVIMAVKKDSVYLVANVIPSKSGIASYEFKIKKNGEDWKVYKTNEKEYIVDKLSPSTTYQVLLEVTDHASHTVVSNTYSFTTSVFD